jgi:hypothetical protein
MLATGLLKKRFSNLLFKIWTGAVGGHKVRFERMTGKSRNKYNNYYIGLETLIILKQRDDK